MQMNGFTFRPVQQVVEHALYTGKNNDTHPELVYADECPELWQQHSELADVKSLFYSLTNPAECKGTQYTAQIDLNSQRRNVVHREERCQRCIPELCTRLLACACVAWKPHATIFTQC